MRFRSPAEAKAMRRDNAATVFAAGLIIAAFVSIPIVNLATPLFGMAFMVHMHKRLSGSRPELIEPPRAPACRRSSAAFLLRSAFAREQHQQQADASRRRRASPRPR